MGGIFGTDNPHRLEDGRTCEDPAADSVGQNDGESVADAGHGSDYKCVDEHSEIYAPLAAVAEHLPGIKSKGVKIGGKARKSNFAPNALDLSCELHKLALVYTMSQSVQTKN